MLKTYVSFGVFFLLNILSAQHNWVQTNPGGGGAIAMVGATADGTIVAASDLSGIYLSSNNGESWEVKGVRQGLTETHISALGFHPTDGDVFFIGTGGGLFKTTDGGNSIYPVDMEISPDKGVGYVESIGMAFSNENIGYMAHYEWWDPELTLLKTIDGGESWFKVVNDLPETSIVVKILTDKTDADLVYALCGRARFNCSDPVLYKSQDGGQSWLQIATDLGPILDIDVDPTNSNTIFVTNFEIAENGCDLELWEYATETGRLYKSIDGGASFNELGSNGGTISVYNNPDTITVTDMIAPSEWNENAGTWTTTDGGNTWTHTGFVQDWTYGWTTDGFAYALSFNGLNKTITKDQFRPKRLYAAFGQWAWSSIDGGNKLLNISTKSLGEGQYITTGLENIEGNALDVNDSDPNIIYVGYYDLGFWYSKNHGLSWKKSYPDVDIYPDYSWWQGGGSNCNFVLSDPERSDVVWATFGPGNSSTVGALFKSTEFGENWVISNDGLPLNTKNMHGMSLDPNSPIDNRILYLTLDGDVYKSSNDGNNWSIVLTNGGLKFTEVDKFNSNLIYAGGENGFWRSIDAGVNWEEVGLEEMRFSTTLTEFTLIDDIVPTYGVEWADPPIVAWQGIFDIKADPNIANRVYATAYGPGKGMYRSNDGGLNWEKLYTNDKMRCVAIATQNSDVLYISSSLNYNAGGWDERSEGFLMSTDAGNTWIQVNDGMAWINGARMEIEHGDNPYIWGFSPGTGLQYADISHYFTTELTTVPQINKINIYPNPVKNVLFIDTDNSINNIKVLSMTGVIVLEKTLSMGEHSIQVSDIPAGVYMVQVNGVDWDTLVVE